jgi:hypothetical protein
LYESLHTEQKICSEKIGAIQNQRSGPYASANFEIGYRSDESLAKRERQDFIRRVATGVNLAAGLGSLKIKRNHRREAPLRGLCVFASLREPSSEELSQFLAKAQRRKVAPLNFQRP